MIYLPCVNASNPMTTSSNQSFGAGFFFFFFNRAGIREVVGGLLLSKSHNEINLKSTVKPHPKGGVSHCNKVDGRFSSC